MDEQQIRKCISLFLLPGQITEVRALGVSGRVVTKCFSGLEVDSIVEHVGKLDGIASGIYFVPNPVRTKKIGCVTDADICCRNWVLVDFDPVRPAKISSSEEEKKASLDVCLECKENHLVAGMKPVIFADSGNGYHLVYSFHQENTTKARLTTSNILKQIAAKYNTDAVKIDTSVYNAARIWKFYGTTSRKGEATEDRPHRVSKIIEPQEPA